MQPKISMTKRNDNFLYPSGFSCISGLHERLLEYLFLSKSKIPVVANLLITCRKILVNWEPFFIMTELCSTEAGATHTGLN